VRYCDAPTCVAPARWRRKLECPLVMQTTEAACDDHANQGDADPSRPWEPILPPEDNQS